MRRQGFAEFQHTLLAPVISSFTSNITAQNTGAVPAGWLADPGNATNLSLDRSGQNDHHRSLTGRPGAVARSRSQLAVVQRATLWDATLVASETSPGTAPEHYGK